MMLQQRGWVTALVLMGTLGCSTSGGSGGGGDGGTSGPCTLVNDASSSMPAQYSDSCVEAAWVTPYLGTYESDDCQLVISQTGTAAPVFTLTVKNGNLAGTYAHDYEGGTGMGNDSYYKNTADTTYTTATRINFGVGKKVDDTREDGIGFTVSNVDSTPTYSANFQTTVTSPFSNKFTDCGDLTKS